MKRWKILNKLTSTNIAETQKQLISLLLENRGITDEKEIEQFLNPKLENITIENVGIDNNQLKTALQRIKAAIEKKEKIIIYGDYDVDGITSTAILWETIYSFNSQVMPYIPDRIDEGYGLSIKGIQNLHKKTPDIKLIITVDNGIVANEAVDFANQQGIHVIITDHHTQGKNLPKAIAIVHTTKLCGAGIAYLLSRQIKKSVIAIRQSAEKQSLKQNNYTLVNHPGDGRLQRSESHNSPSVDIVIDNHLELAALGTIADMVPLTGANRIIVKYGLEKICNTQRPGLRELLKIAGCETKVLGVYEIGFIIAPRLNAAGRIENAMDSLRLLCTKDKSKGFQLAHKLELTNRERQLLMKQAQEHASLSVKAETSLKKLLIVAHENYREGVIGLVAGKLVEEFYRPSIVITKGEKFSKASARSITGFNIIEFLRSTPEYFVNVGGHPMAAGFTIETGKLLIFKETLESAAEKMLDGDLLIRSLRIDCELPFDLITRELFDSLRILEPFGIANPDPVFMTKNVIVKAKRIIGRDGKHLRLNLKHKNSSFHFEAIAFGMGELASKITIGDQIDLAYSLNDNTWNGTTKLQLKIKDIKLK